MSETSDGRAIDGGVKAVIERVDALLRDREEMDEPDFLFVGVIPTEPRWLVDTAALPAELATKVVAREKAFGSPPPLGPGYRADPSRDSSWDVYVLGVAGVLLPFIAYVGLFGLINPIAQFLTGAYGLLVLASLGKRAHKYRGPLALTPAEARLVEEHTTTIDPCWLDFPSRINQRAEALHVAAFEVISAIGESPAWKSEHCDLHRIQLDLAEEAYQVTESCMNLRKLSDMIAEAQPTGTSSSAMRRQLESTVAEYETLYERAQEAVANRVAALYAYKSRLAGIETLIRDIEKTATLSRRSDDFAATFRAIVRDEYAAANTRTLAGELADLQARLQTELVFISGQIIEAPALAAPLTRVGTPVRQPSHINAE